ncbi:hypothetical protein [Hahella ganghwensis]|uniref:hypothetical protein n=1 Tax=Hahella ganghwensis TaxID=286420 RepID=UPI00036A77DD|nr:hypothetical protein [Hahella ganghwensis]
MRTDTSILIDQIYEQSTAIQIMLEQVQSDDQQIQDLQQQLSELWKELEEQVFRQ